MTGRETATHVQPLPLEACEDSGLSSPAACHHIVAPRSPGGPEKQLAEHCTVALPKVMEIIIYTSRMTGTHHDDGELFTYPLAPIQPWCTVGVVPANVKCTFLLFSLQGAPETVSACWRAFVLNMEPSVWLITSWTFLKRFLFLKLVFYGYAVFCVACWEHNASIMPLVWITPKTMCNSICTGLSICDEFHSEVWLQTCWTHVLISPHRNPNEPLQPSTLHSFPPSATSSSGDAQLPPTAQMEQESFDWIH